MKNAVLSDVTQCGLLKNRRFGGTCRLHHQGKSNQLARNNVSFYKIHTTSSQKTEFVRSIVACVHGHRNGLTEPFPDSDTCAYAE
jgi:hypothetical protein